MQGFKSQSATPPTAMGSLLQSSAYGATIPVIYGQTQSPLLAIWAANLRQGGSVKKFKQLKKGITAYCENIDFLVGHNPIMGILQMMVNGSNYPLTFTSQSFTAVAGRGSYAVTDPNFYYVTGVTVSGTYSFATDDYGASGPSTLAGSWEIPLWNELETGPDPTNPMSYRAWPYVYRWQPGLGATVYIDPEAFPGGTVKIYYAQLMDATSLHPPIVKLRAWFESELGNGSEYANAPYPWNGQQIVYPQFAGLGSDNLDLGASGALPQLLPEVRGKWGIYPTGDADFVDMIEDIFKSGLAQAAIGASTATTQMERGLSSYDMPGTMQKKMDAHATVAMPAMSYDMPCTAGNMLVAVCSAAGTLAISSSAGDVWTPLFSAAAGFQVWTAPAIGGANTVTISGSSAPWSASILEVGGAPAIDSSATVSLGLLNNATGSLSKTADFGLAGDAAGMMFENFAILSAPMPADAVVQAIYAVADFSSYQNKCGITLAVGIGMELAGDGGTVGGTSYGGAPVIPVVAGSSSGQVYGNNFSADFTAEMLPQLQFAATLALGINGDSWSPPDTLSFSAVGFAIYVTTATVISGTPPLTAPVTVPAGQQVIWALPTGAVTLGGPGNTVAAVGANVTTGPATGARIYQVGSNALALAGASALTTGSGAVTSNVEQGLPAYLLSIPLYAAGTALAAQKVPLWEAAAEPNFYGASPTGFLIHERRVRTPGAYAFATPGTTPTALAMLSFKNTRAATYSRPLGDFMDLASLDLVRAQCRANGLWGSLSMNSQSTASDWLKSLYAAANAAPVILGSKLFSLPYSEVSAAGNGAIYTAPTAAGPVATLDADNGDFVGNGGTPKMKTASRIELPNVLQMQCISREANYNQVVVQQPDAASIALYGMRKADPIVNNAVQDPGVARSLLAVQVRKNQYGADTWSFTLSPRWQLLAPMDLVTITDRLQGIVAVPVRITSKAETQEGAFQCAAEPFVYGMYAPTPLTATVPTQNPNTSTASAGNVNAPVIFEPTPRLSGLSTQAQLWLAVSSAAANYGGAQVYISTDGGASYNPAGDPLAGSAITGVSTADWPAAADPDTVNNLALDLTESNGALQSYTTGEEDNFLYPCLVAGGGAYSIAYELMAYATATLTATSKYTLAASGTGNHLRRGVYGAPAAGVGVDHPLGSRFAFLPPSGAGILKLNMDPAWIGVTLYFKICSFNAFGGAAQGLADVTAYTYTPTGAAGSSGSGSGGFLVNGS